MQTFKSFLSEEVVPTAYVHDGSIDLQKEEVRSNINIVLNSVGSQLYVTPYSGLHHISKALAQFHIILPKRTYMEGSKGIEVYEMRQFGNVIGMNDKGEFINKVPVNYYLFVRYQLVGLGMFQVIAKVVEKEDLDGMINQAELSLAEEKKDIPDSDDPPFKGGHKRSHEKSSTHVKRLAQKALHREIEKEKGIVDSDKPPFKGGHKRSHEKTSTHVHRLAVKAMKRQKDLSEARMQGDDEDEKRKKVKQPLRFPAKQSMDQMVRRVRGRVGKKTRQHEE